MNTSTLPPYQELELEFGLWAGVDNVVACSSGTAALHLALEALRLPPNSQVIVPNLTMVACARAVVLAGHWPVFVDCLPNLLMDPLCVSRAIELAPDVKAVMPVHVYGRAVDMGPIIDLAKKYELKVIEDLAEAHGVPPHPNSDAAAWSFYANKIIAGEEGGAVAFREEHDAAYARQLRSLGFTDAHDFTHVPRGHNYRLANSLAAIIRRRLHVVAVKAKCVFGNGVGLLDGKTWIEARREIERWYDERCPERWRMHKRDAAWVYDIRIRWMTEVMQSRVVASLVKSGINARHCFKPMSEQPEFALCTLINRLGGMSIAGRISREVIYLPIVPTAGFTPETVDDIFTAIESLV